MFVNKKKKKMTKKNNIKAEMLHLSQVLEVQVQKLCFVQLIIDLTLHIYNIFTTKKNHLQKIPASVGPCKKAGPCNEVNTELGIDLAPSILSHLPPIPLSPSSCR